METVEDHHGDEIKDNTSAIGSLDLSESVHEKQERKISKLRLAKQDEVEVMEEYERFGLPKPEVELTHSMEDEHSPNSDESDCTVVAAGKVISTSDVACTSPKDSSPEDCAIRLDLHRDVAEKASETSAQVVSVKVRLVRSKAVCDDVSSSPPPPDIHIYQDMSTQIATSCATLMLSPNIVVKSGNRHKLGHDGSQGSSVSESGTSPALSRDSSFDAAYTDSTGTNLEEFIIRTLNKNRNDCAMLLRLENDMIGFIKDSKQEKHKFPQMSSYHRMLVHRIAAFFGLEHNVDDSGKCVVINKSVNTRVPDFKFREHIWEELSSEDQPKKLILRRHRDCTSLETLGTDRISVDERKSKSFEEREEEYLEARNRIFQQQHNNVESQDTKTQAPARPAKLCHEDCNEVHWLGSDVRPWSSTDSSGYSTDGSCRLRVSVTKASSFHGVTVLTRGDSSSSANSRLSKTDSTSSGLSGLSSPVVIPPTIPCSPPNESMPSDISHDYDLKHGCPTGIDTAGMNAVSSSPFLSFTDDQGEPLAIWVASTIEQIPPGSFIINPQTGKPYTNPDGSLYKWYPPQSACQGMMEASDKKFVMGSSQYGSVAHNGQEPLSSSLSGISINPSDAQIYSPSSSQFCVHPQPQHVVCQPAVDSECGLYRYLSPTPAAVPTNNASAAVQLMTLPEMTVQSIETYPVAVQLPPGQIHHPQQQQQNNALSQPYCVEVANMGQMKPDVNYKGNASSVFYTPVAMQMQLPVQRVRYHLPSTLNTPYQSVMYPEHIAETVENGSTSSSTSMRYVYYTPLSNPGHSTESQHPYTVSSMSAHNVLPVTTCCSSVSSTSFKMATNVRTSDQPQFGPSCTEAHPRPVVYRQPTNLRCIVAGDSRTLQQHLHMSFHQDMQRLRMPRLPEGNPVVYQAAMPAANANATMIPVQQNVMTWPMQAVPVAYTEGCGSNVLEVCGLPPGLHYSQLDSYLADLVVIHGARRIDVVQNCNNSESGAVSLTNCTVLAIFDNESTAQKALASNAACGGKFQLQIFPYHHS